MRIRRRKVKIGRNGRSRNYRIRQLLLWQRGYRTILCKLTSQVRPFHNSRACGHLFPEPQCLEPTKEKKEKKEKKRKHRTHEQGGEAVLDQDASVVPTEGEGPSKKAKKLKRDHDLATAESEAATDPSTKSKSEKKDKKSKKEKGKKEKKERAIDIVESSVTTTENTPTTSTSSVTSPSSSVPSTPPSEDEISTYLSKNAITIHTPPSSSIPFSVCPVLSFSQLRIPEELRGALKGFKEPTPIQACSWPVALEGKDVVGVAETGR